MAFSPDDAWLLSVSRDRSWALSRRSAAGGAAPPYELAVTRAKAHARVIWSCAWSPDSRVFATASRDGEVRLWDAGAAERPGSEPLAVIASCASSANAVAFAPVLGAGDGGVSYVLAVGAEKGAESGLFRVDVDAGRRAVVARRLDGCGAALWPAGAVSRIVFRAVRGAPPGALEADVQMAVVAADHTVRVVALDLGSLVKTAL